MRNGLGIIWLAVLMVSVWAYVTPKKYTSHARIVGKLLSFKGDVFVREPFESIWKSVFNGNQFTSGTFISTGKKSNAEIEIEGGYKVNIPPESQVSLDIQTGHKNELVLNIISGELTVLKPAKKETSFLTGLSRKYTEMTLDKAPISIAAAGSTYALTTEVTKAQFQKKDDGVSLVYSDGKIKDEKKATDIAPTSVPIAISSKPAIESETPDPSIDLDKQREREKEKETELARIEYRRRVTENLALMKAGLKIKPYSFIRLNKTIESGAKKSVLINFTGIGFSNAYQYVLNTSSDSNFKQAMMPSTMTNKQLIYQISQSQIDAQVQRSNGKFEMNYELNVVSPEVDEDITAQLDKGTINFIDIKSAASANSFLDLYYSPVPFIDEDWQPRFGKGSAQSQHAFQYYSSAFLPKMLENTYQNYGFNLRNNTQKDSFGFESNATIFIKNASPILVSSNILDPERLSDLKNDVNFDFIYDGKLRDLFRSGKELSSTGTPTAIESLYFPAFSRGIRLPAALNSIQKKNLLEQFDTSFLINQKERLSNLEPLPLSAPEEMRNPLAPKKFTFLEKKTDGTFTINHSSYQSLFSDLKLTSTTMIKANFAANSINIEKSAKDSPSSTELGRFILGLKLTDYVIIVAKKNERNELTIMRQNNLKFIEDSFKDLKDTSLKKTVEKYLGYDCLAKSDGAGKAIIWYPKSTNGQNGIYIWKGSAKEDRLDQQFLSQGMPLLALCEQPLKDGCYARIIPKVAFHGILKCSSSNFLNNLDSL